MLCSFRHNADIRLQTGESFLDISSYKFSTVITSRFLPTPKNRMRISANLISREESEISSKISGLRYALKPSRSVVSSSSSLGIFQLNKKFTYPGNSSRICASYAWRLKFLVGRCQCFFALNKSSLSTIPSSNEGSDSIALKFIGLKISERETRLCVN